jgi:hypothetical protein
MARKPKKFKAKPFKLYLDELAKLAVKTRAGFACEVKLAEGCTRQMRPLDCDCQWIHIHSRTSNVIHWDMWNTLCACGACHQLAHAHPTVIGEWFKKTYSDRDSYCLARLAIPPHTWKEIDFREEEQDLLDYLVSVNADYLHVQKRYRQRVKRAMELTMFELERTHSCG